MSPQRAGHLSVGVAFAVSLLLAGGCTKSQYVSGEGAYCSRSDDEDPYYRCQRGTDLICITTSSRPQLDQTNQIIGSTPLWLCRLACNPGENCAASGDVCCPGMAVGGMKHACVPEEECIALLTDGGAADRFRADAGTDATGSDAPRDGTQATGDAGPTDAPGDAATTDAPGDAATIDATVTDAPVDAPVTDAAAPDAPTSLDAAVDAGAPDATEPDATEADTGADA